MDTLLFIINLIGIVSFAAAGAIVAIDKETDFFGVIFLSVITCFGGGLIRDVIAGQAIGLHLPVFFSLHLEIAVCIATAILVFFVAMIFKKRYVKEEQLVCDINNILDALGLGVFCAAGTASYLSLGPLVAIIMGMLSSVGGSLTRDIILRDIPFILRKRIYALACILGSSVYYVTAVYVIPNQAYTDVVATVLCSIVIFSIRICATYFKWNMPKAIRFSDLRDDK